MTIRSIERWRKMVPMAVVQGSQSQVLFCIEDAQADILTLAARVKHLEGLVHRLARQIAETSPSSTAA